MPLKRLAQHMLCKRKRGYMMCTGKYAANSTLNSKGERE
jgi:hypothetical protein